jgi:hypothetical protein
MRSVTGSDGLLVSRVISAAGKILRVHGLVISASDAEMANYGDMP